MIIKVSGMRDPENIRAVSELGVDLIGMTFCPQSERYVTLVNSHAGIIPDRVDEESKESLKKSKARFVGSFVDEMPQTVVTNVYNFNLDYVQLHGEESTIYIDNLRATLDPDIHPGIKIIKSIRVSSKSGIDKAIQYEGHADMLLFDFNSEDAKTKTDWAILETYSGTLPFILSVDIGPGDEEKVKSFHHPNFAGIDLNMQFETAPAEKDVVKLKMFLDKVWSR